MSSMKDKLIAALDVRTRDEALRLVETLSGTVGMFKVGSRLFMACGPGLVREIIEILEQKVFLDLKFHDTPRQVEDSAAEATSLGVTMFTIHCSGGKEMMQAAVQGSNETALREDKVQPLILGVSVLTTVSWADLGGVGVPGTVRGQVRRLAKLAEASGLQGLVSSGQELDLIKKECVHFTTVIAGVRLETDNPGDQKRVVTPGKAISMRADYLVVGDPIINNPNPVAAAQRYIEDMEKGRITRIGY